MTQLFRWQYIFFTLGIALVVLFITGGAILQRDWQAAHRSYSVYLPAIDWVGYRASLFLAETKRAIIRSNKVGLPQVRLYVPERAQAALLSDIPVSTKKWRKAFLKTEDGDFERVKVRYRGDNPTNWIFGQKSWRVKTKKSEIRNGIRTREYVPPQGFPWSEYIASLQAIRMGLLAPRVRFVELFVNDKSDGVYMERERLDESFLRYAGLMPVNLYKGEQFHLEAKERVDGSLFNNSGLWSKISVFNQKPESDFSDLTRFIGLLRRAEVSDAALQQFNEMASVDIWAEYAAYQLAGGGFHNGSIHNLRVVIDPWSGHIHPIPYDVGANGGPYDGPLELSSHDVLRLLNMQPEFILAKYRKIIRWTSDNGPFGRFLQELNDILPELRISLGRDIHLVQGVYAHGLDPALLDPDVAAKRYAADVSSLKVRADSLRQRLSATPRAEWRNTGNRLSIAVDGELPLGDVALELDRRDAVPKVFADLDGDRAFGPRDVAIPVKATESGFRLDAIFVADRVPAATRLQPYLNYRNLVTRKTRFELIFSRPVKVHAVHATNPLTGREFVLPKGEAEGALPARFNRPLVSKERNVMPILWSGTIRISEDRVLRVPVRVAPGTHIVVSPGANLMFRDKLEIEGTENRPVIIRPQTADQPWGALSLVGPATAGSSLKHVVISGGSGGELSGLQFVGMLSIHDTSDIVLEDVMLDGNSLYDDMVHIVYGTNITLKNCTLLNPNADGVDIDISTNVHAIGVNVSKAKNDAFDLMSSEVIVEGSTLSGSGDKGISVGEKSTALVANTVFEGNKIGVESKDGSHVQLLHSTFDGNSTLVSAYKKNWRYGAGGSVDIRKSILSGNGDDYRIKRGSHLSIFDSAVSPTPLTSNRILLSNSSQIGEIDASVADYGSNLSPLFSRLQTERNPKIRGIVR